jgi:hypothetical protein
MRTDHTELFALLQQRVLIEDPSRLRKVIDFCLTHEDHTEDEHGDISCFELILEYLRKYQ